MGTTQTGWHPTPAPAADFRYDDIWFISPETGWAVSSEGLILHTNDGGASWARQFRVPMVETDTGPTAIWLRCVSFASAQRGWVGTLTGKALMFQTVDGGKNWTSVSNLPANAPLAICGLYAVSESVVYASGTNWPGRNFPTRVMKTSNGGETWIAVDMGAHASNLIDIFFFDENRGFVVGGHSHNDDPTLADVIPVVLSTEDGGQTWVNRVAGLVFEPGEWGWKICFVNNDVGYVSLESFTRAAVLKTTDGGRTWTRHPINDPQGNIDIEGVGFITEDCGWVGGWGHVAAPANLDAYRRSTGLSSGTTDGGPHWVNANEVGCRINRFRFPGTPVTVGYASGRQIYKYHPEGDPATWPSPAAACPDLPRFTDTAEIDIKVPTEARHAWVHIWNRFGLEIRLLLDESNPASGARKLTWDGLNDAGQPVPAGIYIFRLTVDDNYAESVGLYLDRGPRVQ
jgi:photosystem II stability/assembly factor-like uncharacterized protein